MTGWKQLFLLADALERAALEHHAAQWGDFQYAGLTVSQSRAYITLWKLLDMNPEGISLKTLSRKLHVTPGAASEMVDLLAARLRANNKQTTVIGFGISYSKEINSGFYHSIKLDTPTDSSKEITKFS